MPVAQVAYSWRAQENAYVLLRNKEDLKSPKGFPFAVPTRRLADAIVKEFSEGGSSPDLRKMPLAQLALTALDVVSPQREQVIENLMRYGETELICHRAEAPSDLVAEQEKKWDPYLAWCKERFGVNLVCGRGIALFDQDKKALSVLRAFVEGLDPYYLTGLGHACGILGSLVLGLALFEGRATAREAFDAAELDGIWQGRKWGADPETEGRHAGMLRDLELCATWLDLLR